MKIEDIVVIYCYVVLEISMIYKNTKYAYPTSRNIVRNAIRYVYIQNIDNIQYIYIYIKRLAIEPNF